MGWAAIDFELANADRASACALGLVLVQESQIVKRRSWLIRPSKLCFDLNNVALHGITADHVAEMPTFAELWDEVHSEIQGMPLVAHNASFDIGVLRHTLDAYKIPYPELDYYCTRAISQALWTALPSYGLELVSHFLGLQFTHHSVEEDAMACAAIVLRGCSEVGVPDLTQLAERLMIRCGHLAPMPRTKKGVISPTRHQAQRRPYKAGSSLPGTAAQF
jgi:DNA polymerase III subunit epsilon